MDAAHWLEMGCSPTQIVYYTNLIIYYFFSYFSFPHAEYFDFATLVLSNADAVVYILLFLLLFLQFQLFK